MVAIAITVFALFRTAAPTNESEFKRLAAYDLKDGKEEADADLAEGRPRWITYGGPAFDIRPGALVLHRKLGLQRDHIAYCAVTPGVERYAREYNRVVFDRLESLFGHDLVLNELRAADIYPWIEEEANQPRQRNAGSRPSSDDSSASETPSSLGPRG